MWFIVIQAYWYRFYIYVYKQTYIHLHTQMQTHNNYTNRLYITNYLMTSSHCRMLCTQCCLGSYSWKYNKSQETSKHFVSRQKQQDTVQIYIENFQHCSPPIPLQITCYCCYIVMQFCIMYFYYLCIYVFDCFVTNKRKR